MMRAVLLILLALVGCSKPSPDTLTVGVIAGPEAELVETARDVASERYGLKVKVVEFSDYNLPNEALENGSLDANVYQHLPYLQAAMKAHRYPLEVIGKTFIYPTGLYSSRYHALKDLPDRALIAVPNDPSNEVRALMLLQEAGLVTLRNEGGTGLEAIVENPKKLRFKELDAAQLPRVLADVDGAVINTTFAVPAGLNPMRDALVHETRDSPYANLIVIRENSAKRDKLLLLVKALNSPEVVGKAQALFGDAAIRAW